MVDVEHRSGSLIAVRLNPRDHGGVHVGDQRVAAAVGAARDCDLRQRAEFDVLRIGIASLHGLPGEDFYVRFLVFTVEERHGAEARIGLGKIHPAGFAHQRAPHHALILIAGDGHLYGGGVALGDRFQRDIIAHGLFLSQPFSGCVQKRQFARRVKREFFQLALPGGKIALQRLAVVVNFEDFHDIGEGKSHVLERCDPAHRRELILPVIPVIGEAVDLGGFQETDLVIMAQHADADSGQF